MADAFGNYLPGLVSLSALAAMGIGTLYYASGAPDDANGSNGDAYIDISSGDVYRKYGGGWTVLIAGTGAVELVYIATPGQNPNGVSVASRPAMAYDSSGALWMKTNTGSNNTGWVELLAP